MMDLIMIFMMIVNQKMARIDDGIKLKRGDTVMNISRTILGRCMVNIFCYKTLIIVTVRGFMCP